MSLVPGMISHPPTAVAGEPTRIQIAEVVAVNADDNTIDARPINSRATKAHVPYPTWWIPALGERCLLADRDGDSLQPICVGYLSPQDGTLVGPQIRVTVSSSSLPKATTSVLGIVELSANALDPANPVAVSDQDTRLPTQPENDALAGTSGAPSGTNKYVTNTDTRLSDARTPAGAASGDLAGSYPAPTIATGLRSLITNALQPGSAAGGDLAGTYPNPAIATGLRSLITGALQPGTAAGGDLGGTYPNPVVNQATNLFTALGGIVVSVGQLLKFGSDLQLSRLSSGILQVQGIGAATRSQLRIRRVAGQSADELLRVEDENGNVLTQITAPGTVTAPRMRIGALGEPPAYCVWDFEPNVGDQGQSEFYAALLAPGWAPTNDLACNFYGADYAANLRENNSPTGTLTGSYIGQRSRLLNRISTRQVNNAIGLQASAEVISNGSGAFGSIVNAYGLKAFVRGDGGSITNGYGAYIASAGGAVAFTNVYGVYIENQALGSALNYALYSAGGQVLLNAGGKFVTPLVTRGVFGQAVDVQQWQDTNGRVMLRVASDGTLEASFATQVGSRALTFDAGGLGLTFPADGSGLTFSAGLAAGLVLVSDGDGASTWVPASSLSGVAPTGAAGGDLSGSYPNPVVVRGSGTIASETPSTAGIYLGTLAGTQRVVIADGSGTRSLEIDNGGGGTGGGFRFYKPGTVLATLTGDGDYTVARDLFARNLNASGDVVAAGKVKAALFDGEASYAVQVGSRAITLPATFDAGGAGIPFGPSALAAGQVLVSDGDGGSTWASGAAPTGAASGDLAGSYPAPTIAAGLRSLITGAEQAANKGAASGYAPLDAGQHVPLANLSGITDAQVAAANKDGAAGTASMRTLGTGAQQAAAGNDSRITGALQSGAAAGGDLAGTYPNPTIAQAVWPRVNAYGPYASRPAASASNNGYTYLAADLIFPGGGGGLTFDAGGLGLTFGRHDGETYESDGSGWSQSSVGTADPRIPTQDENDALQGTSGSPSNTNRYVTNSDPRVTSALSSSAQGAILFPASGVGLTFDAGGLGLSFTGQVPQGKYAASDGAGGIEWTDGPTRQEFDVVRAQTPAQLSLALAKFWAPTGTPATNGPPIENISRLFATTTITVASGALRLSGGAVIPAGRTVSAISFWVGAAPVTPSNQWFSLYSIDLRLIGTTVDDTTTPWPVNTAKTLALVTPFTPTVDTPVYIGYCVVAATPPSPAAYTLGGNQLIIQPLLGTTGASGLTTPATAPAVAAAVGANMLYGWLT